MDLFKKVKAKLKFIKEFGFGKHEFVNVDEIPKKWDKFLNTENEWIKVSFPEEEEVLSCVFFGKKGQVFQPHKHKFTEQCLVINKNGKVEVLTTEESKVISFGDAMVFPKEMVHAITFLEDTKLLCLWHEKKEEAWTGTFVD